MDFELYREKVLYFQKKYCKEVRTILDLACGPGNIARLLYEKNNNYVISGIDLSEEMVKLARQSVPDGKFQVCDLREIDFADSYDAIIASFAIVHLTDQETRILIEKVSHLINPGGYLYLSFMAGEGDGYETTSFSKQDIYFNYYKKGEIQELLASHSLRTEEVLEVDYEEADGSISKDIFVIAEKISHQVKKQLLVSVDLELVDYASLPRSEKKSQRVFDDRIQDEIV